MVSNTASIRATLLGFILPPIPGPAAGIVNIPLAGVKAGDYAMVTLTPPSANPVFVISSACMVDGFIETAAIATAPFPGGPVDLRIVIIRATGSI
jgi:hypothetical protein